MWNKNKDYRRRDAEREQRPTSLITSIASVGRLASTACPHLNLHCCTANLPTFILAAMSTSTQFENAQIGIMSGNTIVGGSLVYNGTSRCSIFSLRNNVDVITTAFPVPDKPARVRKRCPLPIGSFEGRKRILDNMHRFYKNKSIKQQRIFVLHGIGGAGKSQIAYKFVQECQDENQYESWNFLAPCPY